MNNQQSTGFKDLLNAMMTRRWFITALVLGGFMIIMAGIFSAIVMKTEVAGEWKELLLLLLGAFIGSYGKIIDYWFSDTDKDKMLVQKMDEEDGVAMSNTKDMQNSEKPSEPEVIEPSFSALVAKTVEFKNDTTPKFKKGVEIDEDGDGIMDGIDEDGDGDIDMYFEHRQCEHVWGDSNNDGELECQKCGLIKDWFTKNG
jgi:hypothetical protein